MAYVDLWTYGDQANDNHGMSGTDTAGTTLYQGDRKIADNPWSGCSEFTLLPEEATHRLRNESTRSGFSDLSTGISVGWTFRSSWVSYDDGTTWQPAPLLREGGQWLALLCHPAQGALVSFKATAGDRKGNTVGQTIIRGRGPA